MPVIAYAQYCYRRHFLPPPPSSCHPPPASYISRLCPPVHPPLALSSPGVSSAIAIALGRAHTCAIVTGSGVKCWGANGHGQLGIGSTVDTAIPKDVAGAFCPPSNTHARGIVFCFVCLL
jgi:alpha-tubulin suppressor-like RCC1 family protein